MTTNQSTIPPDFKYWAFISYSHADKNWGDWLHKAIETFKVPSRIAGRVSRDGKAVLTKYSDNIIRLWRVPRFNPPTPKELSDMAATETRGLIGGNGGKGN